MPEAPVLAPGARVEIRGVEWIVRRVDSTSTGGHSVAVTGVSELVRGRETRFLTEIEGKGIVVLDPAETKPVADGSPQYRDTRLYLEALLRQSPPTGNDVWIGHRAAIDLLPFQVEPALQALEQPRQRFLMADAVGLGKTIEVGISLFPDDLVYTRQALDALRGENRIDSRFDADQNALEVTVNDDLKRAFRALPKDALPDDGRIWFTTDRNR